MKNFLLLIVSAFLFISCMNDADKNKIATKINFYDGEKSTLRRTEPHSSPSLIESDLEKMDAKTAKTDDFACEIAKIATSVKDVHKASVVISGDTAVIGVEVTDNLTDSQIKALKSEVKSAVLRTHKNFERVAVTASLELIEKMTEAFELDNRPQSLSKAGNGANDAKIQKLTPTI